MYSILSAMFSEMFIKIGLFFPGAMQENKVVF